MGLGLLFTTFGGAAQSVRPIIVTPTQPVAGDRIEVAFDRNACELIIDGPNDVDVARVGSAIDIIIDGRVNDDPLLCMLPPARAQFPVGSLAPGRYAVRMVIREFSPPFVLYPPSATGTLVVSAVSIPGPGAEMLGILAFLMLVGGLWTMKRASIVRSLSMVAVSFALVVGNAPSANAQASDPKPVYITLSAAPQSPTPEMVVEQWNWSAGASPPLLGLSSSETVELGYLLPVRASGAFLGYLLANPNSPRALLERTVIVWYVPSANIGSALAALRSDPNVLSAHEPLPFESPVPAGTSAASPADTTGGAQSWVSAMSLPGAWALAGGWSLIGVLDNGLAVTHPDLVSVGPGNVLTGGNWLTAYSLDNGRYRGQPGPLQPDVIDFDVDERQPIAVTIPPPQEQANPCDPNRTGFIRPSFAGHGSHVAGLIGANHANSDGTVGACRNCGIAMTRNSIDVCDRLSGLVAPSPVLFAITQALTYLIDNGAQVVNGSFGVPRAALAIDCTPQSTQPECVALQYAATNGVLIVASSGNNKTTLNWPARDSRVVAVGGLNEDNATFWENRTDLPNTNGGCPVFSPPALPNASAVLTSRRPRPSPSRDWLRRRATCFP